MGITLEYTWTRPGLGLSFFQPTVCEVLGRPWRHVREEGHRTRGARTARGGPTGGPGSKPNYGEGRFPAAQVIGPGKTKGGSRQARPIIITHRSQKQIASVSSVFGERVSAYNSAPSIPHDPLSANRPRNISHGPQNIHGPNEGKSKKINQGIYLNWASTGS